MSGEWWIGIFHNICDNPFNGFRENGFHEWTTHDRRPRHEGTSAAQ